MLQASETLSSSAKQLVYQITQSEFPCLCTSLADRVKIAAVAVLLLPSCAGFTISEWCILHQGPVGECMEGRLGRVFDEDWRRRTTTAWVARGIFLAHRLADDLWAEEEGGFCRLR